MPSLMGKLFSNYSPPYTHAYNKVYIIMEIARLIEETQRKAPEFLIVFNNSL